MQLESSARCGLWVAAHHLSRILYYTISTLSQHAFPHAFVLHPLAPNQPQGIARGRQQPRSRDPSSLTNSPQQPGPRAAGAAPKAAGAAVAAGAAGHATPHDAFKARAAASRAAATGAAASQDAASRAATSRAATSPGAVKAPGATTAPGTSGCRASPHAPLRAYAPAHAGTGSWHRVSTTPYRISAPALLVLGLMMGYLGGAQGLHMPSATTSAVPASMWSGTPSILATSDGEIKAISDGEVDATSRAEIQVSDEPGSKLGSKQVSKSEGCQAP